jgi:hypothetical protein
MIRATNDGLYVLAIFHILLTVGPYIYIHLLAPKKMRKREFFFGELKNVYKQVIIGSVMMFLALIAMLIVYAGVIEFKSSLIS